MGLALRFVPVLIYIYVCRFLYINIKKHLFQYEYLRFMITARNHRCLPLHQVVHSRQELCEQVDSTLGLRCRLFGWMHQRRSFHERRDWNYEQRGNRSKRRRRTVFLSFLILFSPCIQLKFIPLHYLFKKQQNVINMKQKDVIPLGMVMHWWGVWNQWRALITMMLMSAEPRYKCVWRWSHPQE